LGERETQGYRKNVENERCKNQQTAKLVHKLNNLKLCTIWGSHNSVAEDSSLVEYHAVFLVK
jgi:hypothetical protein